jgi:hypothetical protein
MGYVTTYCNKPHSEISGKPIGHECYVLPVEAIRLERAGDYDGAIASIAAAKPLSAHKGIRPRPEWWPKKLSAAEWRELDSEHGGICLACGELDYEQGCEPDARGYRCGECHAMKVYGAEEARMMGAIEVAE